MFVAVPADVADGGSMLLENFMHMLGELFPPLFRERWNWDANQAAVVGRVQTEVRGADRFLNRTDKRNVIRLNSDERWIGGSQLRDLIYRGRSPVIVDLNVVQNGDRR